MKQRFLLSLLITLMIPKSVWAGNEPYAVLSNNNTTLTFYYDTQKASRKGMDVGPFEVWWDMGWNSFKKSITSVVFDPSLANCASITSTADWFWGCTNLTSITGIENLKTQNVTNMNRMFGNCSSLTSLNLIGFNMENVTNMGGMFMGCTSLISLDLSNFNTKNVTEMRGLFQDCTSLVSLNMSNWSNDKITSLRDMFFGLKSLTSLNLSGFKTDNVTDMSRMFYECSSLTSLDISSFNTGNVTEMGSMFYGCSSLTNLDVSGFRTENVTGMSGMFYGCSNLTKLDVSRFRTENVTNMVNMFRDCSSLTNLDVSGFKTDNVISMAAMFCNCSSLASLDVSGFNTNKVTTIWQMFYGCSGLKSLDVSHFNTENVSKEFGMMGMFFKCSNLTSLDVSRFKTDNVTDMRRMFYGCSGLTSLDVSGFNTANVTKMSEMFTNCSGLTELDVSGFNTMNVTEMYMMFYGCSSLTSLDLNSFKTENVQVMYNMFWGCSELKTIYVAEGWSTASVISGGMMFHQCVKLVGGQGTSYSAENINHAYAHIDGGVTNPGYLTDIKAKTENKELKVDETFTADGITYKVTCVDPMEVAVGVGGLSHAQAIDTETRGAIIIPSSVIGTDENTYSVTSISERAFQDCNELTSVTIPNTVTSIGSSVFLYDRNFTSIIIPKSVTFIGQGAFYGCRKLTSIQVEEGNPVFDSRNNCNAIIRTDNNELIWGAINTVIPNTVTSIGDDAFAQREITSVSIPSSVISIGNSAYYNCASFSTVLIPNSVISIGTEAFAQNGNLSEVTIGKSVKEIGKEAFNNKYIEEIHSYIEDPFAVGENTFGEVYQNTYKTGYLYVPVGTKAKYKTTEGWKEFKNIVEMVSDDDFTYDIGEGDKLTVKGTVNGEETTIEIPAKIVIDGTAYIISIIATNAFKGNTNLQSVTIPETIEKIGAGAFADCKNLTAIHVLSPTPIDLREAAARGLIRKADGIVPSQFEGVNFDECVLYVPYGSEDAYHEAEGWKLFKQIVEVHSENDPAAKVTAKSYTREYGEKNPTFEFIAEGAKLDGEPVIECEATEKSDAGEYDIVVKKGSVKNYNDTYVAGKLTITKAPLKVSVKDVEREQGTENPQFEIVYEGWKLQDTESVLLKKPTATTTVTKDSPVGEYDIIVSGGEANNYELSYAKGKLKVVVPASISAQKANGQPVEIYTTNGRRINKLKKGVNIIRDSSGKTRKVVKK